MSWYTDEAAMARDDAFLQDVCARLRADLPTETQARTAAVHVYPSQRCTYTLDKRRIFVRVRDDGGNLLPECVLREVVLHELGSGPSVCDAFFLCRTNGRARRPHVLNPTYGHDNGFRGWFAWLRERISGTCGGAVPRDYNPCRAARG
jgi:hypothetical protein